MNGTGGHDDLTAGLDSDCLACPLVHSTPLTRRPSIKRPETCASLISEKFGRRCAQA
jgi:hypothetical protein